MRGAIRSRRLFRMAVPASIIGLCLRNMMAEADFSFAIPGSGTDSFESSRFDRIAYSCKPISPGMFRARANFSSHISGLSVHGSWWNTWSKSSI